MSVEYFASAELSDVGRKRKNNEDACLRIPDRGVYCVADGMGGVAGGDLASEAITTNVHETFANAKPDEYKTLSGTVTLLRTAANRASKWIKEFADEKVIGQMGSTFVGLVFDPRNPSRARALHAGDSRVYRWRAGKLDQLTADHTAALALAAKLGRDPSTFPAKYHNELARAVGLKESVELEETKIQAQTGDVFLLCCDGLYRMAADAEINKVLSRSPNEELTQTAKNLINLANEAGGKDNITVILIKVGDISAVATEVESDTSQGPATKVEAAVAEPVIAAKVVEEHNPPTPDTEKPGQAAMAKPEEIRRPNRLLMITGVVVVLAAGIVLLVNQQKKKAEIIAETPETNNTTGTNIAAATVAMTNSQAPVAPTPKPVPLAPEPVAPAPVTPAPAPVTLAPAPITPAPAPAPPAPVAVTPAPEPVTPPPAPVTPTPAPVTPPPAPVTPAPAPEPPAPVAVVPAPVIPTPPPVTPAPTPVSPAPIAVVPAPTPAPVPPAEPVVTNSNDVTPTAHAAAPGNGDVVANDDLGLQIWTNLQVKGMEGVAFVKKRADKFWVQTKRVTPQQYVKLVGPNDGDGFNGVDNNQPCAVVSLEEAKTFARKLTEALKKNNALPLGCEHWHMEILTVDQWMYVGEKSDGLGMDMKSLVDQSEWAGGGIGTETEAFSCTYKPEKAVFFHLKLGPNDTKQTRQAFRLALTE